MKNNSVVKLLILFFAMPLVFSFSAAWAQPVSSSQPNLEEPSHAKIKEKETSMYADFFDKNVYERGVQWFYLPRTYRKIFNIKPASKNVNVYDEIPDTAFFTNRIGRRDMTAEEIISGPERNDGPETNGPWLVTKGKFEGISPGFFIKDANGNEFLLKFDPPGNPELSSGAEAIASRMMYAFGYNVPQYTIVYFDPSILQVWDKATYYGKSGFKKSLTIERVKEAIKDLDRTPDGKIRASASLKVEGIYKGVMSLNSYRKDDPNDYFRHRNMREIRSLIVFSSWLNNHDIRKGNTLSTWIQEKGGGYLKHYFIDFGSSFGSAGDRVKNPTFTFEYFLDYKDILFQSATAGVFEPDWQKQWRALDEKIMYPSVGYFSNLYFKPENWKPEIPHFAFDDLTLGDAFWSTKIIMKLRPETLKGIMRIGQYSNKDAENYIYNTLVERQKMIGKYWFSQVTPLDEFEFNNAGRGSVQISFKDLEVYYDLSDDVSPQYQYRVITRGKKDKEIIQLDNTSFSGSPLELNLSSYSSLGSFEIAIQKFNQKKGKWNPPVFLTVVSDDSNGGFQLAGIWHSDNKK